MKHAFPPAVWSGLLASLGLVSALGCSSESDNAPSASTEPPALQSAPTTVDEVRVLSKSRISDPRNPGEVKNQEPMLSEGFGESTLGPGEPFVDRTMDGAAAPASAAGAKTILRFAHVADIQLTDDESPARLSSFDSPTLTEAALRPQDSYLCHMARATVRTVNGLHRTTPMEFTLLGGDNIDAAQTNELTWALSIFNGGDNIRCDSGDPDEITPGPGNDPKDPFRSEGFAMPWKWVNGNHDMLVSGITAISDAKRESALGSNSITGTRNWANGGEIEKGDFVVADPMRAVLNRKEMLEKVASDGDGHGITSAVAQSGHGTYTFDSAEGQVRVLVFDTTSTGGGSDGVITPSYRDQVLKPLLDAALAEKKWVILNAHHAGGSLTKDGGLGNSGVSEEGISPEEWETFLGGYSNILLQLSAHSHVHKVILHEPQGGNPYWEILNASIADYPHQFRSFEILDSDNGYLGIRTACVDLVTSDDPVAEKGRQLGYADFTSGWQPEKQTSEKDRNVVLWVKK